MPAHRRHKGHGRAFAMRRSLSLTQTGFTLIELLVVIAIIGSSHHLLETWRRMLHQKGLRWLCGVAIRTYRGDWGTSYSG